MDGYLKLPDGNVVPYPVDTQLPSQDKAMSLEIIFSDKDCLVFLPNYKDKVNAGCVTFLKFAIFSEGEFSKYKHFSLNRWDNAGGWRKIVSKKFKDIEQAKHEFLLITKYFI